MLHPIIGRGLGALVDFSGGRSTILRLLARTHLDVEDASEPRLALLIDGTVVGSQPLDTHWRTLAFALPVLEPGPHVVELLPLPESLELPHFSSK